MANKFQVGDPVRIVKDLSKRKHAPGVNSDMLKQTGKEFVISGVPGRFTAYYHLKDNSWSWTEDWLEQVYPEPEDINESEFLSMFGK